MIANKIMEDDDRLKKRKYMRAKSNKSKYQEKKTHENKKIRQKTGS